jgi:hypothetical protein
MNLRDAASYKFAMPVAGAGAAAMAGQAAQGAAPGLHLLQNALQAAKTRAGQLPPRPAHLVGVKDPMGLLAGKFAELTAARRVYARYGLLR